MVPAQATRDNLGGIRAMAGSWRMKDTVMPLGVPHSMSLVVAINRKVRQFDKCVLAR